MRKINNGNFSPEQKAVSCEFMPRNDWYFSKPGKSSFKCIVNFNFYLCYPNDLKTCINKQNCNSEGHFWLNFFKPKIDGRIFFLQFNGNILCMCFCRVYNLPKMAEMNKISDFWGIFGIKCHSNGSHAKFADWLWSVLRAWKDTFLAKLDSEGDFEDKNRFMVLH